MMTPDKDYGQLTSQNIMIYKPNMVIWIRSAERPRCDGKIRTELLKMIDYLGLMGDA